MVSLTPLCVLLDLCIIRPMRYSEKFSHFVQSLLALMKVGQVDFFCIFWTYHTFLDTSLPVI